MKLFSSCSCGLSSEVASNAFRLQTPLNAFHGHCEEQFPDEKGPEAERALVWLGLKVLPLDFRGICTRKS